MPTPPETLSVIVPVFNEAENIERYPRELFPAIDALGLSWELLLVDDGSQDGSLAAARAVAALHPRGRVLVHERNRGLGAALRTGFAAATGTLVLTLDADLTFQPREAAALLARFRQGDVDAVLGAPELAGYEGVPRWRIVLSRTANRLYRLAIGRSLSAITPIFRLYRRQALEGIRLTSERFDINAEVLAKLVLGGARVAEVPARLGSRVHGESKLDNRAEIARHLRLLARILGWRARARLGR